MFFRMKILICCKPAVIDKFNLLANIIAAVVFVIALSRSAGLADRKMEEIYRLSAAREAGGVDGN